MPNDGQGEDAELSGTVHLVITRTEDKSGGFHLKSVENFQKVVLTGQITGDVWHGTGVSKGSNNFAQIDKTIVVTLVKNFGFIGQGSTPNLKGVDIIHITANANGVLTATHDQIKVTCK
jgi:hypothetical protein